MKAILLKTQKNPSKFGGAFYYFFFKDEFGKSRRSCISPDMNNFSRWEPFIGRENVPLDGLNLIGELVNADSVPFEIKQLELNFESIRGDHP
jgi:hypothetical protein